MTMMMSMIQWMELRQSHGNINDNENNDKDINNDDDDETNCGASLE